MEAAADGVHADGRMTKTRISRRAVWREVAAAVMDLGRCTVTDLEPLFHNLTRYEIQNALACARRAGLVGVLELIPTPGNTARMGIWGPATEEVARQVPKRVMQAVSCVWQLGSGAISVPAWQAPARECRPLGDW